MKLVEESTSEFKSLYKRRVLSSSQETRRKKALLLQRAKRQNNVNRIRNVNEVLQQQEQEQVQADQVEQMVDVKPVAASGSTNREDTIAKTYVALLQMPDWMIDVPTDLGDGKQNPQTGWFVLPRPEGQRCLAVAARNKTVLRNKTGYIFKTFKSHLPNGGLTSKSDSNDQSVLECVYSKLTNRIYIVDMLFWKGYSLVNCDVAFRFFWIMSKLSEIPELASNRNQITFQTVQYFEADKAGIQAAYNAVTPYTKDGLAFFNKESIYCSGSTPLVLFWKDAFTSRYPVDTPDGVNWYERQSCVLRISADYRLVTLNGVSLGTVSSAELTTNNLAVGDMCRFSFDSLTVDEANGGNVVLNAMKFEAKCAKNKLYPDTLCKIVYQHNARHSPLTIQMILNSVT